MEGHRRPWKAVEGRISPWKVLGGLVGHGRPKEAMEGHIIPWKAFRGPQKAPEGQRRPWDAASCSAPLALPHAVPPSCCLMLCPPRDNVHTVPPPPLLAEQVGTLLASLRIDPGQLPAELPHAGHDQVGPGGGGAHDQG